MPEYGPERSVNPVSRRLASTERAEQLLGFRAQIGLDEGLRRLVVWWQSQRLEALEA
jgi:UDP-glucose 4-epimerase